MSEKKQQTGDRILYGFWLSPYMSIVAQFLEEAGLEYSYERVSPYRGDTLSVDHLERNPVGKIPCLKDIDGRMTFESLAICRYLARTYAEARPLYPCDDPVNCLEVDQLVDFVTFSISGPYFNWFVVGHYFPKAFRLKTEKESEIFGQLSAIRVKGLLGRLKQAASFDPYLLGKQPTLADIQFFHTLHLGKNLREIFDDPMLDLTMDDEQFGEYYRIMADRPASQVVLGKQQGEMAMTKKELFEDFADAYADVLKDARAVLSKMFGHEV